VFFYLSNELCEPESPEACAIIDDANPMVERSRSFVWSEGLERLKERSSQSTLNLSRHRHQPRSVLVLTMLLEKTQTPSTEEEIIYYELDNTPDNSTDEHGYDWFAPHSPMEDESPLDREVRALQEQVSALIAAHRKLENKVDELSGANRMLYHQVKTMQGFLQKLLVLERKTEEFKQGVVLTIKNLWKKVAAIQDESANKKNTTPFRRGPFSRRPVDRGVDTQSFKIFIQHLDECLAEVEKTHNHMSTLHELIDQTGKEI
jgi:hypothetical protein